MTKYAIYSCGFEELWEDTFDNIDEAVEAIKKVCTDDEIASSDFQIVEIKPVAELGLKIEYVLKYFD